MAADTNNTVVVADDDADVRSLLGEYLTGCGFTVLEAENGLETLLHVKSVHPAAVVLDVHMPRLGGVDALRHIRAFDPSIVIAVVTGDEDPALHQRIVELGAAAVLMKPVQLPALAAALTLAAGGRAAAPVVAAAAAVVAAPAPGPAAARSARPVVLIVDDDASVRDMLEDFLASRGYEVRTASDGATGLRRITEAAPDVVLLDVELPGLNGLIALPSVRAVAPDTVVVMISGSTEPGLAAHARAFGAFDYMSKPVDLSRLAATLENAVAVRRVQG